MLPLQQQPGGGTPIEVKIHGLVSQNNVLTGTFFQKELATPRIKN